MSSCHSYCPLTHFIWDRATRGACDVGPSDAPAIDNTSTLHDADYAALLTPPVRGDGDDALLVYVYLLALPQFLERVWPRVVRRIVLVTGMSDPGPAKVLGYEACVALACDARIVAWYTEMLDFVLEGDASLKHRVFALPLGLDYHTLAYKPCDRPLWGPPQMPAEQEGAFLAIARAAPPGTLRDARVYVHFGWYTPQRRRVIRAIRGRNPTFYFDADRHIGREELWRRMSGFQWVLCVQGGGLDCHRTWEALALGCGVVAEAMPMLDELLGDEEGARAALPHMLIATRDGAGWRSRVTHEALAPLYRDAREDARLTNAYWHARMRSSCGLAAR